MVILDLPAPLSVNRTRRVDWRSMPAQKEWKRQADALYLMQKRTLRPVLGLFTATLTISEGSRLDADNAVKGCLDLAKRYGLIIDDGPKYLRRLVVEFGEAPEGARLTINAV